MDNQNNTGDRNTGYSNTGDWNTGDWNTGHRNTGYSNTGDWNTGHRNTGYRNTGGWNTGDWNTGHRNTGFFNLDEPKVRIFGKDTDIAREDIEFPNYMFFPLTEWVYEGDMSKEEKKENDQYKVTGGYLKVYDYKEAWAKAWAGASEEEKEATKQLPNFDADIFKEITGIDIELDADEEVEIDGKQYSKQTIKRALQEYTK